MGLFDEIGSAKVNQGGVYFLPGIYRCEIVKVFTLKTRKREDVFIVECEIKESNNEERKPGGRASWVVNLKHDAALGNIKGFVAAANGIDPTNEAEVNEEVTAEAVELVCSDDNPLEGVEVMLEATNIKTRDNRDFTLHQWTPVSE